MSKKFIKSCCILIICLFAFSTCLKAGLYAQIDLRPGINSVNKTMETYNKDQKIKAHIKFAKLYAENNQWKKYYKHLSAIYKICPILKNKKIIISPTSKEKTSDNFDIITPGIIKKLASLGLKDINTKQKALNQLLYLDPLCQKLCINKKNTSY